MNVDELEIEKRKSTVKIITENYVTRIKHILSGEEDEEKRGNPYMFDIIDLTIAQCVCVTMQTLGELDHAFHVPAFLMLEALCVSMDLFAEPWNRLRSAGIKTKYFLERELTNNEAYKYNIPIDHILSELDAFTRKYHDLSMKLEPPPPPPSEPTPEETAANNSFPQLPPPENNGKQTAKPKRVRKSTISDKKPKAKTETKPKSATKKSKK